MKQQIQIEGLNEIIKLIGKIPILNDRIYEPVWDAIGQAGKMFEDQIKQNLTDNDNIATGDLRGSISSSDVQITTDAISVEVGIGRELPYAQVVEFGSRPHTPPLKITEPGQPLYEWVRVKQLAGIYNIKTRRRLGSQARQITENRQLARAIWVHIRKYGTKAHPYFTPALDQTRERIKTLMENAVERIIENLQGAA